MKGKVLVGWLVEDKFEGEKVIGERSLVNPG
jgi:hypothetical protein